MLVETTACQSWRVFWDTVYLRNKKYVLSNSESVTFSFLITWPSSSSKSAAVYKISSKSDDYFTKIWRYNDFQNGGRPPSWNCFTTIRDHPRNLCCWPQLPVKFYVNLIHRSEDIASWFFPHNWLEMPIQADRPPKLGLWGTLDH